MINIANLNEQNRFFEHAGSYTLLVLSLFVRNMNRQAKAQLDAQLRHRINVGRVAFEITWRFLDASLAMFLQSGKMTILE